jgi:hypothetical protein
MEAAMSDRFLERLREDARQLRHEPDDVSRGRLAARIRARLHRPATVSQFIAVWFRPIAAMLSALALMAGIGLTLLDRNQATWSGSDPVEISMGGDVYSVAE